MTDTAKAVIDAARLVLASDSYEVDCLTRENLRKALAAHDADEAHLVVEMSRWAAMFEPAKEG